jgi:modulator of FtsH protease
VERWQNFFLGELGASAALAGLIFVSLSVNQARILEVASLPERGLQALLALLLVLVVSSVMLIPAQTPLLVGVEILVVSGGQIATLTAVQRAELSRVSAEYRGHARTLAGLTQLAAWLFVLGALLLILRADWVGAYALAPGALLSFTVAGMNAWVLLIEINR